MEGYIKLHRALLESSVFASANTLKVWVWCLLKASYKDRHVAMKVGRGESIVTLKEGEFIFGRFKAEDELSINGSTIYKIIKKFEAMDMIAIKSSSHYSIITICNWVDYQGNGTTKVAANEQQTNSKRTANEQQTNSKRTHTRKIRILRRIRKIRRIRKEILKKPLSKKMTRETKNQNDFINRIIENFKKEYHQARGDEYVVVARGKDRKAASVLAEMHKKKFPDAKTNETLEGLRLYFEMALQVKDTWLLNNMSLSTLAYKYNEIRETLKNPKTNGQQKRSLAEKMDSANAIIDRMYGNTPS